MWYVIRTETGQEELLKWQIKNGMFGRAPVNCRILYRICKKRYLGAWHDEVEPFLSGYLFLVMEDSGYDLGSLYEILETAGAFRNSGVPRREMVLPIGRDEEEFLKRLTGGKNKIGMSYGVIQNGILKISQGALTGLESRVRKIDRHKRKGYISMQLNNEEKVAEIGLEITKKISIPRTI